MRQPSVTRSRWRCGAARLGLIALALVLLAGSTVAAEKKPAKRGEFETVDAYLERLGLFDLRIRFLEREASKPGTGHSPAVEKLADVYAHQLLTTTDPKAIADLKSRLQSFLKDHPSANTIGVRITLGEGDYNRAEALALKWVADPSADAARAQALTILKAIIPELNDLSAEGLKEVERGNKALEDARGGARIEQIDQALQRTAALAGRVTYFACWANYYRNLLQTDDDSDKAGFQAARLGFLRLLGIPPDEALAADNLSPPDNETQARILLGLGLAELASGHPADADVCFTVLRDETTPAGVRDWADHWHVWALLHTGKLDEAKAVATKAVATLGGEAAPGKLAFCKILIQSPDAATSGLGALGVRGLVLLKRFDLARALMQKHHIESDGKTDPIAHWMRGQSALEAGEASKAIDDFETAKTAFEAALAAKPAPGPELTAECRYALGWCQFRLGDFEDALASFERADNDLTALNLPSAADAAWMVALTRLKLEPPDSGAPTAAIAALKAFQKRYPDHPNARKVDELLAKFRDGARKPDQPPGSAPDVKASLNLARRHYERWSRLSPTRRRAAPVAADLRADLDTLLALPDLDKHAEEAVETLLMAKDLALSAEPPDWTQARALLDRAQPLAGALPPDSRLSADYHYALFERAQADRDDPAARAAAAWLRDHKEGHLYEKAVLAALARRADDALAAAPEPARPPLRAEALDTYRKLSALLGDTPSRLRSNKSALTACSRLAQLAFDSDQFAPASTTLDKLLAAYPEDSSYLRRAGLAHFRVGHDQRALECWRALLSGLSPDSEEWYEAKYYQLSCLLNLNPTEARAVLDQFQLLHPEGGPGRWPAEFRQLAGKVRGGAPAP